MTELIKTVRYRNNEKTGDENDGGAVLSRVNRVEYEFADTVSQEAKEAVRKHVPQLTNKEEIERVIKLTDNN